MVVVTLEVSTTAFGKETEHLRDNFIAKEIHRSIIVNSECPCVGQVQAAACRELDNIALPAEPAPITRFKIVEIKKEVPPHLLLKPVCRNLSTYQLRLGQQRKFTDKSFCEVS